MARLPRCPKCKSTDVSSIADGTGADNLFFCWWCRKRWYRNEFGGTSIVPFPMKKIKLTFKQRLRILLDKFMGHASKGA